MRRTTVYFGLALFLMPYVLTYFPGLPRRFGRVIALSFMALAATAVAFWFGCNLDLHVIKTNSNLDVIIHIISISFGIWLCVVMLYPLAIDVERLIINKESTRFRRIVSDRRVPNRAPICLVRFSGGGPSYYLWFAVGLPEVGQVYNFEVLPKSRVILDFRD